MALSRPKDSIAQPSITVPGVATGGGASSQGVTARCADRKRRQPDAIG